MPRVSRSTGRTRPICRMIRRTGFLGEATMAGGIIQNVGSYAKAPTFQTQQRRVKASALAPNCRRFCTSRRKRLFSRHLGRHARDAALDNSDVCPDLLQQPGRRVPVEVAVAAGGLDRTSLETWIGRWPNMPIQSLVMGIALWAIHASEAQNCSGNDDLLFFDV